MCTNWLSAKRGHYILNVSRCEPLASSQAFGVSIIYDFIDKGTIEGLSVAYTIMFYSAANVSSMGDLLSPHSKQFAINSPIRGFRS